MPFVIVRSKQTCRQPTGLRVLVQPVSTATLGSVAQAKVCRREKDVPQCRHHHRCKQAQGWRLEQPEPGVLVWHTPAGRTYTTTPTQYAS
jgi:hypothetical protein